MAVLAAGSVTAFVILQGRNPIAPPTVTGHWDFRPVSVSNSLFCLAYAGDLALQQDGSAISGSLLIGGALAGSVTGSIDGQHIDLRLYREDGPSFSGAVSNDFTHMDGEGTYMTHVMGFPDETCSYTWTADRKQGGSQTMAPPDLLGVARVDD